MTSPADGQTNTDQRGTSGRCFPFAMVGERHRHEHVHAAQQTPDFLGAVKMT